MTQSTLSADAGPIQVVNLMVALRLARQRRYYDCVSNHGAPRKRDEPQVPAASTGSKASAPAANHSPEITLVVEANVMCNVSDPHAWLLQLFLCHIETHFVDQLPVSDIGAMQFPGQSAN